MQSIILFFPLASDSVNLPAIIFYVFYIKCITSLSHKVPAAAILFGNNNVDLISYTMAFFFTDRFTDPCEHSRCCQLLTETD